MAMSPLYASVGLKNPGLLLRVGGLVVVGEVHSMQALLGALSP